MSCSKVFNWIQSFSWFVWSNIFWAAYVVSRMEFSRITGVAESRQLEIRQPQISINYQVTKFTMHIHESLYKLSLMNLKIVQIKHYCIRIILYLFEWRQWIYKTFKPEYLNTSMNLFCNSSTVVVKQIQYAEKELEKMLLPLYVGWYTYIRIGTMKN